MMFSTNSMPIRMDLSPFKNGKTISTGSYLWKKIKNNFFSISWISLNFPWLITKLFWTSWMVKVLTLYNTKSTIGWNKPSPKLNNGLQDLDWLFINHLNLWTEMEIPISMRKIFKNFWSIKSNITLVRLIMWDFKNFSKYLILSKEEKLMKLIGKNSSQIMIPFVGLMMPSNKLELFCQDNMNLYQKASMISHKEIKNFYSTLSKLGLKNQKLCLDSYQIKTSSRKYSLSSMFIKKDIF